MDFLNPALGASAASLDRELIAQIVRLVPRQVVDAFIQFPDVVAAFVSMGLAAILVASFWVIHGAMQASAKARIALRAQSLRRLKDHRALVLIADVQGGDHALRQEMKEAVEDNFGLFAFQDEVQVDLFPVKLKHLPEGANVEARRRAAVEAVEVLERSSADIIVWGKRSFSGKLDLRAVTVPEPGRMHDVQSFQFAWRVGRPTESVQRALAYMVARRARPVMNRPQDYKPERLQPIVEALDRLVQFPPAEASEALRLSVLNDFASGALSLGERGGHVKWLQKALDARQAFLDRIDRTADPAGWGTAQQEIGRALAALGEREGARDKLEEAVSRLRIAIDALKAADSQQGVSVAERALQRAEQTLIQRRRIGLRWPV